MTKDQSQFTYKFGRAMIDWLDHWQHTENAPRSDWIVYTLMTLAGDILAQAPDDETRRAVLVEALIHFGNASGANVQQFDIAGEQLN